VAGLGQLKPRIAVVGAGWAGCTAAYTLHKAGHDVTLFEANKLPGGRARTIQHPRLGSQDNGQHLLLGAYSETLRLLNELGITEEQVLLRQPLRIQVLDQQQTLFDLNLARFGPLALLFDCQGLSLRDKLQTATRLGFGLLRPVSEQLTVAQWQAGVPDAVQHLLLTPLCLAALNTAPHLASAQVFVNVLRSAFFGGLRSADSLLPLVNLSALLPEQLLKNLPVEKIRLGTTVVQFEALLHNKTRLITRKSQEDFDHLVLAVAPQHIARIATQLPALEPIANGLSPLSFEAITTVTASVNALADRFNAGRFYATDSSRWHWLFCDNKTVKLVVSSNAAHGESSILALCTEAKSYLTSMNMQVTAIDAITEKRATYSCTPTTHRLLKNLPHQIGNIHLTGDYCYPQFPATLESAVRAGLATAARFR
jgi:hydroxysqualene dehydroxylase